MIQRGIPLGISRKMWIDLTKLWKRLQVSPAAPVIFKKVRSDCMSLHPFDGFDVSVVGVV